MLNPYQSNKARIIWVRRESIDTMVFRFEFIDKRIQKSFDFLPGQFMEIGLPNWGECPISICSSCFDSEKFFELAVRDVGELTHKLCGLKSGDLVDVRGPFGNGFNPEKFKDKPLLLIGGGCGFVPLRSLIIDYINGKLESTVLQIFYGCKSEDTILFKNEQKNWAKYAELDLILENPSREWRGAKGLVTDLFKKTTGRTNY